MHDPVSVAAIIVLSYVPELHTEAAVDLGIPRHQNISSLFPTADIFWSRGDQKNSFCNYSSFVPLFLVHLASSHTGLFFFF